MNGNQDILDINNSRLASNAAIKRRDVATVSSYWATDYIQVAGDGSHTIGRENVIKEWQHMFKHSGPVFERSPNEILIGENGDIAWEKGKWTYQEENYFGNYAAMWRKINGKWHTQCELFVSLH
jgi:ketosteroid isomerase-like protein